MEVLNETIQKEIDYGCDIVKLDPFPHQVSGHHCFFVYDNNKLCKPLNEREHHVYQHLPECLNDFLPKLHGIIKVYFHQTNEDVSCFALPLDCSYVNAKQVRNWLHSLGVLKEKRGQTSICEVNDKVKNGHTSKEDICYFEESWVSTMRDKLRRNLQKKVEGPGIERFMLLEDVSRKFTFPCVIDLKMGTRQFGDKDSKEKREVKQKRVHDSTSSSLGVRLCGMQVYHQSNKSYTITSKYKGREYKDEDFKECIRSFLFNGYIYRTEIIRPFLGKLKTLLNHLEKIDGYRFYCSSLLLIYDGDVNEMSHVEIRMIDFAKSTVKDDKDNYHVGPDSGYVLGLSSLINIFTALDIKLNA